MDSQGVSTIGMRNRFQKFRNRLPPMEKKHYTYIKFFVGLTVILIYAGYSDENSRQAKLFIYPILFTIFFFIAKQHSNLLLLSMAFGFIAAYFYLTHWDPENEQKGILPELAMDATIIFWGVLIWRKAYKGTLYLPT